MVFFTQSNEKTFKISSDSYFKSDLKNEKKLDLSIKTTAERIFWRRFYRSWNSVVAYVCKHKYIHICKSKKKYLLAVHNFWIFFSLLLPPRWIFQSIPKIFTSSQELFVGNLHIHRCCVFCWKTKRKGEKMKAFYGNINIKYTVMRVQWSISSRFFFHENFAKVHIGYIDFRMFTKIISTQLEFYIL